MARAPRDRIEPWVLVIIAFALIVAALLSYNGHPVRDSNLYSPHVPDWLAVVLFILIGIAADSFISTISGVLENVTVMHHQRPNPYVRCQVWRANVV